MLYNLRIIRRDLMLYTLLDSFSGTPGMTSYCQSKNGLNSEIFAQEALGAEFMAAVEFVLGTREGSNLEKSETRILYKISQRLT